MATLDDQSRRRPVVVVSWHAVIRQILWRQAIHRLVGLQRNCQLEFNVALRYIFMNPRILETMQGSLLKFKSYTIISIKLYSFLF